MAKDDKKQLCELERQKKAAEEKAELEKAEPWRGIMSDVAKMMKAALEEAQAVIEEHESQPGTDSVIRMAVAIFDATVQAEGARRIVEAQQSGLMTGRLVMRDGIVTPKRM